MQYEFQGAENCVRVFEESAEKRHKDWKLTEMLSKYAELRDAHAELKALEKRLGALVKRFSENLLPERFEEEDTTCRILIGQATLDCLGGRFDTTNIGDHVLKGRGEAVTIHRVHGFARRDA